MGIKNFNNSEIMDKFVRIGVGILIFKENKILLGKRKNSHGDGTWSNPGGHLEFGESIEECAKREVLEETGLEVINIKEICFTEDFFDKEDKHYITIFVSAQYTGGNPSVLEPNKCEKWDWFSLNELPANLFLPNKNLFKKIKKDCSTSGDWINFISNTTIKKDNQC